MRDKTEITTVARLASVEITAFAAYFSFPTLAQRMPLSMLRRHANLRYTAAMFAAFRADPTQRAAARAYQHVVAQSRRPEFFADIGVPDTVDGRFELICLHAFLYLHRLKSEQKATAAVAQRFFDLMFADFDRSLREMGTGDLSVGREVRRMAEAFYGRIAAYESGLAADDATLRAALARNLFGTTQAAPGTLAAMASYLRREAADLAAQATARLLSGDLAFDAPPVIVREKSTT